MGIGSNRPGTSEPHASTLQKACVYCLSNNTLRPEQILLRGQHFYLCAPAGQLVEGYLVVAPYACIPALSRVPPPWFREFAEIRRVVSEFYRAVYRVDGLAYEQGRADGDASCDPDARFPYHAHLCSLPLELDLHEYLQQTYDRHSVSGPHELTAVAANAPYLYVEATNRDRSFQRFVYVDAHGKCDRRLERSRLKPEIARLIGAPERGDWRVYPGHREQACVIRRFGEWRASQSCSIVPPI